MQIKTRRYHFMSITLADFFKTEHRVVDTIVAYRNSQPVMGAWTGTCTVKYTLTACNGQGCTRYSAMPFLVIIPGVPAFHLAFYFHSFMSVQWSFPEAHDIC